MRKWLWALGAAALLVLVAGIISIGRNGSRTALKSPGVPPPALNPPSEITLTGAIRAKTVVKVGAPIPGVLERVLVDTGEAVYEGQLLAVIKSAKLNAAEQLARLDLEKAQARIAELENAVIAARLEGSRARADATRARIELDRAEKTYRRQDTLNRDGATPRLTFEKAENEYNSLKDDTERLEQLAGKAEERISDLTKDLEAAQAGIKQKSETSDEARADMGSGEVHSPADGLVMSRRASNGDPVDKTMDNLFEVATNLTALQVLLAADANTIARIKTGQPARIQTSASPAGITGSVGDVGNGQVIVDFSNSSPAIKPGLSAQVKIKIS